MVLCCSVRMCRSNASLSPLKRRKRIYDDAHEARKQLIKLLVLTQWSKAAPELKIARVSVGVILVFW